MVKHGPAGIPAPASSATASMRVRPAAHFSITGRKMSSTRSDQSARSASLGSLTHSGQPTRVASRASWCSRITAIRK